jgi:hypothetical protein
MAPRIPAGWRPYIRGRAYPVVLKVVSGKWLKVRSSPQGTNGASNGQRIAGKTRGQEGLF